MKRPQIIAPFTKSSCSAPNEQSDCVEVAHLSDGGRAVRDSKRPADGTHFFPPAAWATFLTAVKAGDFEQ